MPADAAAALAAAIRYCETTAGAADRTAQSSPRSAKLVTSAPATTRWSSTRTSTSASAVFSVCVRNSSARLGSAAPDGWL